MKDRRHLTGPSARTSACGRESLVRAERLAYHLSIMYLSIMYLFIIYIYLSFMYICVSMYLSISIIYHLSIYLSILLSSIIYQSSI